MAHAAAATPKPRNVFDFIHNNLMLAELTKILACVWTTTTTTITTKRENGEET